MPSGARKRKAAKKKKGQKGDNNNSNNSSSIDIHNNNSSQENDDQQSHDGRDSEGSEVSSPVSQDQQTRQTPFNDGNEGSAKRDLQVIQSTENKQMEVVARDVEGRHGPGKDEVDKINTNLNSEKNAQSEDVIVEHIESPKELNEDRSFSSSSGSSRSGSSDDESQSLEKTQQEEKATDYFSKELPEIPENGTQVKGTDCDSVGETVTDIDMVVPALTVPTDVVNPEVVEVVEVGFKKNEDTTLPTSCDISQGVVVSEETEDKLYVASSPNLISGVDVNESKMLTASDASSTETSKVSEIVKASETSNGTIIGNYGNTMNLAGVHTDGISNDAEMVKAAVASNGTGIRNEDKKLSSGARPSEIVNGAEHPKTSESQLLVSSAPCVTQRTSWLSCCGLFDAFTGSR